MHKTSRGLLAGFGAAAALTLMNAPGATAAAPHTVQHGETLWSISAANNLTTRTVAVFNDLPEDGIVVAGNTIQVPTVDEGAAALAVGTVPVSPESLAGAEPVGDATHLVAPGETLSAIAAVSGVSSSALAGANGRSAESLLFAGERLAIPAASTAPSAPDVGTPPSAPVGASPTVGLGHIPSPFGELHLAPAAAESWNAMRAESLRAFGQDLHPGGALSAHRTAEQQRQLYELGRSGQGSPANPPGISSHERGAAVDVATPEMRWAIDQIGVAYGWGKIEASNEWWHLNYAP